MAELDYFLRNERPAMRQFVANLLDPETTYELEPLVPADLVRALEIDCKFSDLQLGLVDGSIAAVCERRRVHRVLTTDRADFSTLRIGPRYRQALTLVP